MQSSAAKSIKGGRIETIEGAPTEQDRDWIVLLEK
jgi:hypothetical protein